MAFVLRPSVFIKKKEIVGILCYQVRLAAWHPFQVRCDTTLLVYLQTGLHWLEKGYKKLI